MLSFIGANPGACTLRSPFPRLVFDRRERMEVSTSSRDWARKVVVVAKLGLCSLVPNRNAETEFWVKQKRVTFTALLGKGGHSVPNAL